MKATAVPSIPVTSTVAITAGVGRKMGVLKKRSGNGRKQGANADLQNCHLLEREALGAASQEHDLECEPEGAGNG